MLAKATRILVQFKLKAGTPMPKFVYEYDRETASERERRLSRNSAQPARPVLHRTGVIPEGIISVIGANEFSLGDVYVRERASARPGGAIKAHTLLTFAFAQFHRVLPHQLAKREILLREGMDLLRELTHKRWGDANISMVHGGGITMLMLFHSEVQHPAQPIIVEDALASEYGWKVTRRTPREASPNTEVTEPA